MSISRFIEKQKIYHKKAYGELSNGLKQSHWMWYIFPQIIGLGSSYETIKYSLQDMVEIEEYINNEYLMNNY